MSSKTFKDAGFEKVKDDSTGEVYRMMRHEETNDPDVSLHVLREGILGLWAGDNDTPVEEIKEMPDEVLAKFLANALESLCKLIPNIVKAGLDAGTKYPRVRQAMQELIHQSLFQAHHGLIMAGLTLKGEGDSDYAAMWKFDAEDEELFVDICFLLDHLLPRMVEQMFPIKNEQERLAAVYGFYLFLAATAARDSMRNYMVNCDWANLLENGNFLRRDHDRDYCVKGVKVDGVLPGNKCLKEEE